MSSPLSVGDAGARHARRCGPIERDSLAYELAIPDLRVRPLSSFQNLVFYVISDDVIDVWRVLHTKRDIPSAIAGQIDD